jgi:cell fate (sporulation/competence/biofilm development) regulator YlbF (YheA/YmcA/DUF963 family)
MDWPMNNAIEEKLKDLCVTIAADIKVSAAREQAEAFLADESAVDLYRALMTKTRSMQHRQHHGEDIADEEVQELVELKAEADGHAGIRSFHQAQSTLQGVAELVSGFVSRTLETGVVPTKDEVMNQGGCGEGCGCHH